MKALVMLVAAGAFALSSAGFAQTTENPNYPSSQTPQTQNYPSQPQNYPSSQTQSGMSQTQSSPVYANNPSGGVIPAGTQLQIRTNEAINATADNAQGRTYSAEIAQDVIGQNGSVLIPRGSQAQLTVGKVSGGGTLGTGSNQVALELQSVSVNGTSYQIASNPVQQQSSNNRGIGANKRTAEMTGGGALLGTVIGAIAGGGKGAAIGAAVGAAGGATTQVLTRGHQVSVPAETLLTFKLDQPLTLQ